MIAMSHWGSRRQIGGDPYPVDDGHRWTRRALQTHTQEWKANIWRGGEQLAEDVPIISGSLTLDSSDPIRRRLTVELGGGEKWAPRTADSPLLPYGQKLRLFTRVDEQDGTGWLPWLVMGTYHIVSYSFERPSLVATVEAADLSAKVDEFLFLQHRSFKGQTVAQMIRNTCLEALPDSLLTITDPDDCDFCDEAFDTEIGHYVADAGMSRWDACVEVADKYGLEVFFDINSTLIIRRSITSGDDDTVPANGPDIGTVAHPVLTAEDGSNGNLLGMTVSLSREGAVNAVRINLHADYKKKVTHEVDRTEAAHERQVTDGVVTHASTTLTSATADFTVADVGMQAIVRHAMADGGHLVTTISSRVSATEVTLSDAPDSDGTGKTVVISTPTETSWVDRHLVAHVMEMRTGGPLEWADEFGRKPMVLEHKALQLKHWDDSDDPATWSAFQHQQHHRARRLLNRRAGLIKFVEFDCLPAPWLEPDDKILLRWHTGPDENEHEEVHYVQSVEIDLTGGSMHVKTRSLSTTDPGAGP